MGGWSCVFTFIIGVVIIGKIFQWFDERAGQKRVDILRAKEAASIEYWREYYHRHKNDHT